MDWVAPGYTEIRQLGAGGSGRVVLAVHDDTGVRVAIKYLSEQLRRDPAALGRFQSEARLLTTLQDQNIARMWEYIQDPRGAAIVMELVNGVSLRALLRENGETGPEAALAVLKGSLMGLARAHMLGLVHRDYKPENVIVRDDGVSKLVDFGIAVRQGTAAHPEGTPPYMAPEQWEGGPATPSTDVYAATAVFFECLTGHRPYRSTELSVLGYQHMHAPIPAEDAPEPVRELVMRGLAKDPARRPAGASAFVAELEEVARRAYGEDWEERGRRRLAGLVLLLPLLLPSPPPAPVPAGGTTLFRTVLNTMRNNTSRLLVGAGAAAVAVVAVVATVALASRDSETPVTPVDVVAAAPSVTPTISALKGTTSEEPTPEVSAGPGEGTSGGEPTDEASVPVVVDPTTSEPVSTPTKKATPTPTSTPTKKATPTPTPTPTKKATPTPTPTPTPVTSVSSLAVGGLNVNADAVASGRVTVAASGTAPITLTATFAVAGQNVHTQQVRLRGARTYARAFSHDLGEMPCGKSVTLTVRTAPAAPGGAKTARFDVPACPTRVTGLRVSLAVADSPGVAVRTQIRVATSGTAAVPLAAELSLNGDRVAARSASLSGQTAYTRSFSHSFDKRPCGGVVSVVVRVGDQTATARAKVDCPAGVSKVSILRSALNARGLVTAVVGVATVNDQPVRLRVSFLLGGRIAHSEEVELTGQTSYTRTVSFTFDKVPCGSEWGVTASTQPAAANGSDSSGGKTPVCPSQEESPGTVD